MSKKGTHISSQIKYIEKLVGNSNLLGYVSPNPELNCFNSDLRCDCRCGGGGGGGGVGVALS